MLKQKIVLILHGWPGPINIPDLTVGVFVTYCLTFGEARSLHPRPNGRGIRFRVINQMLSSWYQWVVCCCHSLPASIRMPNLSLSLQEPNFNLLVFAKIIFALLQSRFGLPLIKYIYKLSDTLIAQIYLVSRITRGGNKAKALADLQANLAELKKYAPEHHYSLLQCLSSVDNATLIGTLLNLTIIFAGTKDVFFPTEITYRLHSLRKNNQIIWTTNPHFCVFGQAKLPAVQKFIE